MSEDPKPKPDPHVPSFDELKGQKRPAAPPSADLGTEVKTSQMDPDVLRKVLKQSQTDAPIEPPPKPPSLAIPATTKLQLQPMPTLKPPPPPGGRPLPGAKAHPGWADRPTEIHPPGATDVTTDPEAAAVVRSAALPRPPPPQREPQTTAPALPPLKAQSAGSVPSPARLAPPPPGGSRPLPTQGAPTTERMEPVTPDLIPSSRAAPGRAQVPVHSSAPASPRPPDVSLQQTQLSPQHRSTKLPEPAASAMTDRDLPPGRAPPPLKPASSSRTTEPFSPDLSAAKTLDSDAETKDERPVARKSQPLDIGADIDSEVKKLRTDPGAALPPEAPDAAPPPRGSGAALSPEGPTGPGPEAPPPAARVAVVEVLAHPASTGRLLGAFVVDALLLGAVCAALGFGVLVVGKAPPLPEGLGLLDMLAVRVSSSAMLVAAIAVLSLAVGAAYTTLFAVVWSGRTFGRLVFGLHLVDSTGAHPSTLRALARTVFALLSFALGGLGFWLGLFSARSRTLHDKLCSTFVVRLGPSRT